MVDTGVEVCTHEKPCHPPIPWIQVLAYASLGDTVVEVTATIRIAK